MKYLILIYHNPDSQVIWEKFSQTQKEQGLQYYAELTADLEASGELIVSEALADPSEAKRVLVNQDGLASITDGPFAEVKEHLAGFYLVECESVDRALEIAGRVPEASFGLVEVRPVRSLADVSEW